MNSLSFNIFVTTACNLKCTYCYEKIKNSDAKMERETSIKVLEFIYEKANEIRPNKIYITFHGGEPLLAIDIVEFLISQLSCYGESHNVEMFYSMTTNVTLYNPSMLPVLEKINDLSVSIDGNKETHDLNRKFKNGVGSFDVVINKIKELIGVGIDMTARLVVTSSTCLDIYDNFVFLVDCGIRKLNIEIDFVNFNWSDNQIQEYIIQLKRIVSKSNQLRSNGILVETGLIQDGLMKPRNCICDGGIKTFSILSSGEVYPCAVAVNDVEFCMGVVGEKLNYAVIQEIQDYGKKEMKQCKGCARYNYCNSTRCRIVNKVVLGEYLEPSPIGCVTQSISMELSRYVLDNAFPIYNV